MEEEKISFHKFLVNSVNATNAKAIVNAFIKYKQGEIQESEITNEWLLRFKEYLGELGLAANSRSKYINVLLSIIKDADLMGYVMPAMKKFETLKKKMSVAEEASESVYLNREELKLIEGYKPHGKGEEFTRAIFLICAYTGCRISDAQILSENNFNNGEINFTSIKTKSTSRLPLHPIVPELVKVIKGNTYSETSVKVIVGRCIKDICKNLGINETVTLYRRGERMTQPKWMMVSSHTGRKSFVTNMFLDGYTLEQISRILGHGHGKGDVKITMGYLCTSYADVVVGNRTYLKPDCDDLYDKLVQMVSLGLTVEQSCGTMVINGSDESEIERVKTKYNQSVWKH